MTAGQIGWNHRLRQDRPGHRAATAFLARHSGRPLPAAAGRATYARAHFGRIFQCFERPDKQKRRSRPVSSLRSLGIAPFLDITKSCAKLETEHGIVKGESELPLRAMQD